MTHGKFAKIMAHICGLAHGEWPVGNGRGYNLGPLINGGFPRNITLPIWMSDLPTLDSTDPRPPEPPLPPELKRPPWNDHPPMGLVAKQPLHR